MLPKTPADRRVPPEDPAVKSAPKWIIANLGGADRRARTCSQDPLPTYYVMTNMCSYSLCVPEPAKKSEKNRLILRSRLCSTRTMRGPLIDAGGSIWRAWKYAKSTRTCGPDVSRLPSLALCGCSLFHWQARAMQGWGSPHQKKSRPSFWCLAHLASASWPCSWHAILAWLPLPYLTTLLKISAVASSNDL